MNPNALVKKLETEASELREESGRLAAVELTDESRGRLQAIGGQIADIELRLRAAKLTADEAERNSQVAETANDPETRERAELRSRVKVGEILGAVMKGQRPPSVVAECGEACGLRPQDVAAGHFPLDLLAPEVRERADANTASPTTGKGVNVRPIIPGVFENSLSASLLGCEFPSVSTGGYSTMTLTANLSAGARAETTAQQSTAATISSITREPKIVSARLTYNIRQSAIIGTDSFEPSLRMNLRMAHMQALDAQVLAGNNTAPNLNGLFTQQTNPTDPSANNLNWDDLWEVFIDALDDPFAMSPMDVAVLTNKATYQAAAKAFRDETINETGENMARAAVSLGDVSLADYAAMKSGGLHFSDHMPAFASNIAGGLVIRSGCRNKGLPSAIVPQWNSAYLTVEDQYSGAASGDVAVTIHALIGDPIIPHSAAFSRVDFNNS